MKPVDYVLAQDVDQALGAIALPGAMFLGGGTNLVDLMREGIADPDVLVDVSRLPLQEITGTAEGGLSIGAAVRNADLAAHPVVRQQYPALAQAVLTGASGQIRNMATVAGNLLQRTRCLYFYDEQAPCNKRRPGSGCGAATGFNRSGAILGVAPGCVAVHPSDMAVALTMLDATVQVRGGAAGDRRIPIAELYRLPGTTPERDTVLERDELIVSVDLPPPGLSTRSRYRKVRDRASYAFALVSVAAAIQINDDRVQRVAVALGGVAHKPWRATILERELTSLPATDENFLAAAEAELAPARGYGGPLGDGAGTEGSGFKIGLAVRTIAATLRAVRDSGGAA